MHGQLPEGEGVEGMYPEGEMGYEEYEGEMEGEYYEGLPQGMIPIQPGDAIPEGYQQIED